MPKAKQYICDLAAYQPGLPIELVAREYGIDPDAIIKLASNENPLGPSPRAVRRMTGALQGTHRYPEQYALTQALATRLGLEPASFVIGNGSNDVLDLIARTYLGSGDEAIVSQYAFAMYRIANQSVGAVTVQVPADTYGHDLAAMLAAVTSRTKVIWIANPNNPTGTFVPYSEIKSFLEKVPERVIVVLDEAYYEYLEQDDAVDATEWLPKHPNLILVRTFSKIYGLAGLRVGYGIALPEVAELLNRVRLPFTSNSLAIVGATAALEDTAFVASSVQTNTNGRRQLVEGLEVLGMQCLPAYGNFVTFKAGDAAAVYTSLLKQGVIVRPLMGYGMPEWLRVSVGLPEENEQFLKIIATVR